MSFEQAVNNLEATNADLVKEVVRVRDAAMGLNNVYPDVTTGRQATDDGKYFAVPGTGTTYMTLYRVNGSSADEISRYPSQAAVDAVISAYATEQEAIDGVPDKYPDAQGVVASIGANAPKAPGVLDGLRRSVEASSGGRMTVFYTAKGQPSYFVRQGKFLCEDVAPGGELGTGVHEAFKFGAEEDAEIWVGAYAGAVVNGEGVSQPGLPPGVSIDYDAQRAACQACGPGFDSATIWDWAAIVHWCMAHGFEPRGNTSHGRHHDNRWETGTRQDNGVPGDSSGVGNILTGSGPAEWRHDSTMAGISDMVGNVWEWLSGMKIVDGRVFLSPDNAIPAESGYTDTGFDITDANPWSSLNTTGASDALKRALVVPKGVNDPVGRLYVNASGERLPLRGGNRYGSGYAGLGALSLVNSRTTSNTSFGFRPRFRNP